MKKLNICLLSLILVQLGFGQNRNAKPDLSGKWRLVDSRIIQSSQPGGYTKTLTIVQRDPEIRVTSQLAENGPEKTLEQVYFSDNRGESNPTFVTNQSIRSKTSWKGDRLETRYSESHSVRSPSGEVINIKLEIRESWEILKDGSRLTHSTYVSGSGSGRTVSGGRMVNGMSGDASPAVEVFSRVEQ
jgi:hypothetical protein